MTGKFRFKRFRRRLLFHLLRLLALAVSYTDFNNLKRLGRVLGAVQYRLGGRRRHLAALIPRALGRPADAHAILKTAYRENTRAVLEILALYSRRLPDATIEAACEIEGLDHLNGLEKGAILLGTHSGNGVLLPTRLALMGYPVCVAVRESGKIPDGFYVTGQRRYGIQALDAGSGSSGLKAMIRALRGGALLYILMDQGSKHHGVDLEFLGKPFRMPGGPAVLARRCDVPIIPAPTIAADPVWRFRLGTPLRLERDNDTEQDARYLARISEKQIRTCPELWTWHHRRWGRRDYPRNSALEE